MKLKFSRRTYLRKIGYFFEKKFQNKLRLFLILFSFFLFSFFLYFHFFAFECWLSSFFVSFSAVFLSLRPWLIVLRSS